MSENKFIKHLKGEATAKSLVEIQNQATPASFAKMPQGTSNANDVYSDHRGNVTIVANGTTNWKLDGASLTPASVVNGDGTDYTSILNVSGTGLWVNATYTFPNTGDPEHPVAMVLNPNTKWVLKLCGDNLVVDGGDTIELTLVITIGTTNIITKQFTVKEQANQFCKELVIDFAESNSAIIKAQGESTMRVQVLCGTVGASARIYNGMTVLTLLQRKVDATAVSSDFANVEDFMKSHIIPSEYFSNAEFIDEVQDGDTAYPIFQRDGDEMNLAGWGNPEDTPDGETIIRNGDGELQVIGTTNKNEAVGATNPIYDWIGTYAEFTAQAIATTHPDWLCFITDDGGAIGGIYTAAECDALFARKADTYTKVETNTALANKANTDADNFTNAGTTYLSKLGYFGERYQQIRLLGSGTSYVAPANGWFTLEGVITNATGNRLYLILRSNNDYMAVNKTAAMRFGALASYRQYISMPVRKGDTVFATYESTTTAPDFALRFYYAEGNTDYTPPEHTLVEYIEGTSNTQYIKTNIKPSSNMRIYCKAKITGNSSGFTVLGTRNATYDGVQFNISIANQYVVVDWFGGNDSTKRWLFNSTIAQNDVWELEIENSVATLTRNGTVAGTHTFTPTGSVSRELYLTGLNNNGAPGGSGTTGQLHEFKLWDNNGNLIMDMQPAKDESNVACLYNTVMQTLYYNQGAGTYTAGPDVN